jgi:hypothetical protein
MFQWPRVRHRQADECSKPAWDRLLLLSLSLQREHDHGLTIGLERPAALLDHAVGRIERQGPLFSSGFLLGKIPGHLLSDEMFPFSFNETGKLDFFTHLAAENALRARTPPCSVSPVWAGAAEAQAEGTSQGQ